MLFLIINFTVLINLVILVFFYFVKSFIINLSLFLFGLLLAMALHFLPTPAIIYQRQLGTRLGHRSPSFPTPPPDQSHRRRRPVDAPLPPLAGTKVRSTILLPLHLLPLNSPTSPVCIMVNPSVTLSVGANLCTER